MVEKLKMHARELRREHKDEIAAKMDTYCWIVEQYELTRTQLYAHAVAEVAGDIANRELKKWVNKQGADFKKLDIATALADDIHNKNTFDAMLRKVSK